MLVGTLPGTSEKLSVVRDELHDKLYIGLQANILVQTNETLKESGDLYLSL